MNKIQDAVAKAWDEVRWSLGRVPWPSDTRREHIWDVRQYAAEAQRNERAARKWATEARFRAASCAEMNRIEKASRWEDAVKAWEAVAALDRVCPGDTIGFLVRWTIYRRTGPDSRQYKTGIKDISGGGYIPATRSTDVRCPIVAAAPVDSQGNAMGIKYPTCPDCKKAGAIETGSFRPWKHCIDILRCNCTSCGACFQVNDAGMS